MGLWKKKEKEKNMTAIKEKLLVPTYKIYKKEEFG